MRPHPLRSVLSLSILTLLTSPALAASYQFMNQGQGYVILYSWTTSGSALQGNYQVVQASEAYTGRPALKTTNYTFSGTQNGNNVVFVFVSGFFKNQHQGNLSGKKLTINYPRSSGGFDVVQFNSASTTQYNQAVTALQKKVQQAQQVWDKEDQVRRKQQALVNAVEQAENRLSSLFEQARSYLQDSKESQQDLKRLSEDHLGSVQGVKEAADNAIESFRQAEECYEFSYPVAQLSYVEAQLSYVEASRSYPDTQRDSARDLVAEGSELIQAFTETYQRYNTALSAAGKLATRHYTGQQVQQATQQVSTSKQQLQVAIKTYEQTMAQHQQLAEGHLKRAEAIIVTPPECE